MTKSEAMETATKRSLFLNVPYVVIERPLFFGGFDYSAIRQTSWNALSPNFPELKCVGTVELPTKGEI